MQLKFKLKLGRIQNAYSRQGGFSLKTTAYQKPHRLRGKWRRNFQKYKYYYILLAPGLLYFLVFRYVPLMGVSIAFKDYRFVDGIWGSPWVGLKWFENLFTASDFMNVLGNTLIISLYKLVFCFPAPLLLALLFNELRNQTFKRTVQTIVYLPHFISWVVISGLLVTLLSPSSGLISMFGMETSPLIDPGTFRGLLVVSEIWKETGWETVIYLAAITSIGAEMYEAAKIDGAGRLQQILYITLPALKGTIAVLLILRTGKILSAGFDQVYNLYSPIVYDVADIIDTYVYRIGLSMGRFSLAAAAGLFQSVVGFVLVLITNRVTKSLGEEGLM